MFLSFDFHKIIGKSTSYYWYLNICIYDIQSCYETSRQNKKEEGLGYNKSVNFTASFVKVHVIVNYCNSVTFFAGLI